MLKVSQKTSQYCDYTSAVREACVLGVNSQNQNCLLSFFLLRLLAVHALSIIHALVFSSTDVDQAGIIERRTAPVLDVYLYF